MAGPRWHIPFLPMLVLFGLEGPNLNGIQRFQDQLLCPPMGWDCSVIVDGMHFASALPVSISMVKYVA